MDSKTNKKQMNVNNYIALMVVITILVVFIAVLVVKNLGTTFLHNQRIISKKNAAQKTLAADFTAAQTISKQYQSLGSQSQIISDALPTESDIPGLANSIEAMGLATGTQLVDVGSAGTALGASTPTSTTTATPSAGASPQSPIPVPVTITVNTTYANLPAFLSAVESSVRPIVVSGVQMTGTNSLLKLTVTANTYSQAPASFTVTKEVVK